MAKMNVHGSEIAVFTRGDEDYICITDIARYRHADRTDDLIRNWLRNRNTIEFLGIWEQLNNPDSKPVEFDGFKKQAGLNSFILTAKRWISQTNAIGLISKAGRYGKTSAHSGHPPVRRRCAQHGLTIHPRTESVRIKLRGTILQEKGASVSAKTPPLNRTCS